MLGFDHPVHAVVCGATGGLGLAFVDQLLQQSSAGGAGGRPLLSLFALARNATTSEGLSQRAAADARLRTVDVDLTDEARVEAAVARIAERTDTVHLVINCVGVLHGDTLTPEKRLTELSASALAHSYAVNAIGPVMLIKHVAPLLPTRSRSLVASLSARVGSIADNRLGGWYSYRAAKAAQNMLLRTAAIELRRRHPACVCVALHPGTVDTALSAPFQSNVPKERLFSTGRAAAQLLHVLGGLGPEESGGFFAWDGEPIPW